MNYNSGKVDIYSIFFKIILLNGFISLTARVYPTWIPLGKIIGTLVILILMVIYCKNLKLKDILFLKILLIFTILPIIKSTNMTNTVEQVMQFITSMLILWKAADSEFRRRLLNTIYSSKKLIKIYIYISIIILAISFLLPFNYKTDNGQPIFIGFALSHHILSGTLCFYMALMLVYLNDKKLKLIHLVCYGVLILAIFMSGARTYLGATVFFMLALYFVKLKRYSLRYLIVPTSFIFIVYSFLNSSSYLRFISTMQNKYISSNILEAITSGRIIWWKIDIDQYTKFSLYEQLFGAGHSIVYDINEKFYNLRIWAHNDFIQLLLATGIIGLIFYIFIVIRFFYKVRKNGAFEGVKFPTFILLGSFIINVMFNGYYTNFRNIITTVILTLVLFKSKD